MDILCLACFEQQTAERPWSYAEVDGTRRYEIRPGDHWQWDTRAERSEIRTYAQWVPASEIKVSYEFMLEPGPRNTADWMVLGQFHSTPDKHEKQWSPPFAIYLDGESMTFTVRSSSEPTTSQNPKEVRVWQDDQPIIRGHWYDMDIRVTFSPQGKGPGMLEVRRDGVLLFSDRTKVIGYNDKEGVYWKEGVYRSPSNEAVAIQYRHLSIEQD